MGGEVKVESRGLGHGATFIIELQTICKVNHNMDDSCLLKNNRLQFNGIIFYTNCPVLVKI